MEFPNNAAVNHFGFSAWKAINPFMIWVNKIVPKLYGWSDLIIKSRQGKVDHKDKMEKVEKKAYEIMRAQHEERAKSANGGEGEKSEEGKKWKRCRRAVREWDLA